jgi:hypothetical protein
MRARVRADVMPIPDILSLCVVIATGPARRYFAASLWQQRRTSHLSVGRRAIAP